MKELETVKVLPGFLSVLEADFDYRIPGINQRLQFRSLACDTADPGITPCDT